MKNNSSAMPVDHSLSATWPLRPMSVRALVGSEEEFRPRLFDAGDPRSRHEIESLISTGCILQIIDTLPDQLQDLVESYHPSETKMPEDEAKAHIARLLDGRPMEEYGTWVYYPWSGRLLHVLPKEQFFFLRTDRNQFRLTKEQQHNLASRRIGIVGLSVGQATALTLALEGVGGYFKLADFDTLALSNLNRLRSGVHNLGVNKAVLAAREMYEINPYIEVEIYRRGMTEDQLDDFLLGRGRLDLLVEECDDLVLKVRLRERARELKTPVVMETSDRGMLDVERFDLEPERPLLHGLMSGTDAKSLAGLPLKEKMPFFLRVLDDERMSDQLLGSLVDIKTSISSWPQLASAVALGGAVVTDVARRLLLGQFTSSGRFYVDLSEIVKDGAALELTVPEDKPEPPAGPLKPPPPLPKPKPGCNEMTEDEARYLVSHAILAPSGGNSQPWRFRLQGRRLEGHLDTSRARAILDWRGTASLTAMGCALENLCTASEAIGLVPEIRLLPDPDHPSLAFLATFGRGMPTPGSEEKLRLVYERVTNRRRGDGRLLESGDRIALMSSVADPKARLHLLESSDQLAEAGKLLGRMDRFLLTNKELHQEMMNEIRWSCAEAQSTRDGLELASLELTKAENAAMRVLRQWRAMDFVRRSGAGRGLETAARKATIAASAVGLLTYEGTGGESYIMGGRSLARVWGTASSRGLAFQPHSPLTYLFARLDRGRGEGLTSSQVEALEELRQDYRNIFNVSGFEAEILLFRVSYAGPPTVRSMRRNLDDVFTHVQ